MPEASPSSHEGRARGTRACTAVTAACLVLQLVLGGHISLFGAVPDFLLVAVFFLSLRRGSFAGVVSGFALGLVFDLLGAGTVGLSALVGCVFGYVCSRACKPALFGEPLHAAAAFLIAAFVYNMACVGLMAVLGMVEASLGQVVGRAMCSAALDGLVALVVFALHAWLSGARRSRLRS